MKNLAVSEFASTPLGVHHHGSAYEWILSMPKVKREQTLKLAKRIAVLTRCNLFTAMDELFSLSNR